MPDEKLVVENLTKEYGSEVAVDNLSVEIGDGEFKSLLGPSGCGKTTTLRCIAGIEEPTSGEVYIDGDLVSAPDQDVHVKAENRDIGMVFQSYAIWPHMTVGEHVKFPLKMKNIGTKTERKEKVDRMLEMVGLHEYKDSSATELSGGQQQRVAISRALVVEPEILLFDEPLSNLDAKLRREMRSEIDEICNELGITVFYVTHAQDEAMFLSDVISLMYEGSIIEEGAPEDLHTRPESLFAMDFMGHSNHVKGTVTSRNGSKASIDASIGTIQVNSSTGVGNEDDVVVSFRPKFCQIDKDRDALGSDGSTVLEGSLQKKSPTRDFTEYAISIGGKSILVRDAEPLPYELGDRVYISIDSNNTRVFPHEKQRFLPQLL